MKYLTIINQELSNGTDASVMHAHDTREQAESEYFTELASGVVSTALKKDFAMVVSTDGSLLRMETVDGLAPSETTETASETSDKTASGQ